MACTAPVSNYENNNICIACGNTLYADFWEREGQLCPYCACAESRKKFAFKVIKIVFWLSLTLILAVCLKYFSAKPRVFLTDCLPTAFLVTGVPFGLKYAFKLIKHLIKSASSLETVFVFFAWQYVLAGFAILGWGFEIYEIAKACADCFKLRKNYLHIKDYINNLYDISEYMAEN